MTVTVTRLLLPAAMPSETTETTLPSSSQSDPMAAVEETESNSDGVSKDLFF